MNEEQSSDATDAIRRAIILSADMLGFSNMVCDARSSKDALDLATRLGRFAEQFSGTDFEDRDTHMYFDKKYWAFSDSIVVCWYGGSEAQALMTDFDADLDQLSGIALAQAVIMRNDEQLVRGGVAQGWFLEHEDTVVGDALVTAARIEKTIGTPFIGVEHQLYDHYLNHPVRKHYGTDPVKTLFIAPCGYTNDMPALDYFMTMLGEIDLSDDQIREAKTLPLGDSENFRNDCWSENRLSYIKWHRDFIVKGLQHPDEVVRVKYRALKQHHNYRATPLYPGRPDMLIP